MPKKPTTSSAEPDAARAAARNTDSAPAKPAPPAAGKGDPPAQKAIDTQTLATSGRVARRDNAKALVAGAIER